MRSCTQFNNMIIITFSPLSKWSSMHGPLKTKNENVVATVIAKIIRDDERYPKNLQTDRGKEFYNANVQKLLKKHGINHYSTYSRLSNDSTLKNVRWRMICGNSLRSMEITDKLICYHILYQSATRESIGQSVYETYRRNFRDRQQTFNDGIQSHKDRRTRTVQSGNSVRVNKFKTTRAAHIT